MKKSVLIYALIFILLAAFFIYYKPTISGFVVSSSEAKVNPDVYSKLRDNNEVSVYIKLKENGRERKESEDMTRIRNTIGKNKTRYEFKGAVFANLTLEEVEKIRRDRKVEKIEVERVMEIFLEDSVPLINATPTYPLQIEGINLTGSGETICILDTGVNYNHSDLGGCYGNNDANSGCKVIGGYDYVNNDNNPLDDNGHGTHVSGIAAAKGVINGVAPDAKIVMVKVCGAGGSCAEGNIIAGIDWCVNNASIFNISIISMSLGAGTYSSYCNDDPIAPSINNAVANNIAVVIATGNGGRSTKIASPACVENAIPVSSTDKDDSISSFSNRYSLMKLFAPGKSIVSTSKSGDSTTKSGTSMATPHVAGAIAIVNQFLKLTEQNKNPKEIEDVFADTGKIIYDSAQNINYSRINLYDAIINLDNTVPIVTLANPENNKINRLGENITFNCEASDLKIKSMAFYLWNSTRIYNETSLSVNGASYSFSINVSDIPEGNYEWNCIFTDENDNVGRADSNYTLGYASDSSVLIIDVISPVNNEIYDKLDFNVSLNENGSCWFSLNNGENIDMLSLDSREFYYIDENESSGDYNATFYCNNSLGIENSSDLISFRIEKEVIPAPDIVSPIVNLISPVEEYSAVGTTAIAFQYNASDESNISNCTLIINDIEMNISHNIGLELNEMINEISPGNYSWKINCVDEANNIGGSELRNFVIDSIPVENPVPAPSSGGGGGGSSRTTSEVVVNTENENVVNNLVNNEGSDSIVNELVNETEAIEESEGETAGGISGRAILDVIKSNTKAVQIGLIILAIIIILIVFIRKNARKPKEKKSRIIKVVSKRK
ncbi:MAG: S8 family serine peptidase [archaeon]|nr:S8 family serine peptidase [archaeon]